LADVAHDGVAELAGFDDASRVAFDQRNAGALDGDIGTGAHGPNGSPVPSGSALTYNATGGGIALKTIGSAGNDTIFINPSLAGVGNSSFTYADVQTRVIDPLTGSDSLSMGLTVTASFPVAPAGGGIVTRNLLSLSLGMAAHLIVATASTRNTGRTLLIIQSATLGPAATIDLGGNDTDFTSTPLRTMKGWLTTGYAGGNWNGTGIDSSFASADTTHLTALGMMQINQVGSPIFSSGNTFDKTTPGAADVLVKCTYYGDFNLDGKVDRSDYSLIDNGYLNHLAGWFNGDFNYDGVVNGSDYTLIDNAFNMQGASLASQLSPQTAISTAKRVLPFAARVASFIPSSAIALAGSTEQGIENLLQSKDLLDGLFANKLMRRSV